MPRWPKPISLDSLAAYVYLSMADANVCILQENKTTSGKLIQLTQKGKVEWNSVDPSIIRAQDPEDIVSSVFICSYNQSILRIYLRKYKSFPVPIGVFFGTNKNSKEEKRWCSEVVLELIDGDDNSVWQFPKEKILHDLLDAVKYKASGAHDVIQSLLNE